MNGMSGYRDAHSRQDGGEEEIEKNSWRRFNITTNKDKTTEENPRTQTVSAALRLWMKERQRGGKSV